MKLLMIADGRSPITRRWISMLQPLGLEIVLISSYPCEPFDSVNNLHILPLAFASYSGSQAGAGASERKNGLAARFRPLAQKVRHVLGPWTIKSRVKEYRAILELEKPDLVHAFRIPFEGMLASYTPKYFPLILSTWGNDFTLHAPSTSKMSTLTRQALKRADAIMSDVQRDTALALKWGFDPQKPALVVPGNGGLDLQELMSITDGIQKAEPLQIINPRGLRTYVRNDTFFKSVPLVLAKYPQTKFLCPSMAGQTEALEWISRLGIEKSVTLLPMIPQADLWREFARSVITVSVSTHDGLPNSLLEGMALGCLPICGDIESIREWIDPGVNGLLVEPADPVELAEKICFAIETVEFRNLAAIRNTELVKKQAAIDPVRQKVKGFYERML